MSRSFFSKRLPFFGNRAMLVLCAVFFVLPFLLRGARESIDTMKNDVADWLPKSFDETTELSKFRKNFIGDQFVAVTWAGCTEADPNYALLLQKIRAESQAWDDQRRELLKNWSPDDPRYIELKEELDAREWANERGLHTTGDFHESWGEHNEKWLLGKDKQWYFINKKGEVFKWDGQNNVIQGVGRYLERFFNGKNKATGKFVRQFGTGEGDENRFYRTPTLLCARFFTDVTTGPEVFEQMAGDNGTIRMGNWKDDDKSTFEAKIETHQRLTGVLFGPTPPEDFEWTLNSLKEIISPEKWAQLDEDRKVEFVNFVDGIVESRYGGDKSALINDTQDNRLDHWYRMWQKLQLEPPARQTCLIVTLNDPVLNELARAVGRPVLGKPRGRILELATGQAGIKPENLHIGGPPVDNVAIDEEGSITLFRLVGLSAVIGLSLAYLSFRSIPVTLMVFFVGGMAAISGLAFVWFGGSTMDAILMTMPSLVYVLGLSGAVHVVNYYRDACEEFGPENAAERAVKLGWFPCTLAAFTTALGLVSLYTSNLTPIKKFGLFSAIATMATVVFLFTYLPASLTVWPPKYKKRQPGERRAFSITNYVERFWDAVGNWVVKRHTLVAVLSILMMGFFAYGITKIETSVQLLKLFRSDAKILKDYHWMEENLGKLVPMELVINVDADMLRPEYDPDEIITPKQLMDGELQLSMLQRMELSERIRRYVLHEFGDEGKKDVGNCMSSDMFSPLTLFVDTAEAGPTRLSFNSQLEAKRLDLLNQDYLRVDASTHEEMWRISLRLAALNDVDYGLFVAELKTVVEPVLSAYRTRLAVLKVGQELHGADSRHNGRIVVIGPKPRPFDERRDRLDTSLDIKDRQSLIFAETFIELLENSNYRARRGDVRKRFIWLDTARELSADEQQKFIEGIASFDSVVMLQDHDDLVVDDLIANSQNFIDARDHHFLINSETKEPLEGMLTAAQRKASGDPNALITTTYTGIVPIVYKAQRTLLTSLIKSIMLAFVMIAVVMMILLRSWGSPVRFHNLLNVRAGMLSMLPNIFPIVIIFGAMGHTGNLVDIGSMMTASVAMGVAVDDTIHFLNWFRHGMNEGESRIGAIKLAYKKVATAMTQTTLIGGLGLSAFAFSTFMPTQRFGILMLMLLAAALVGDLIFLPALLASPLGKYFCPQKKRTRNAHIDDELDETVSEEMNVAETDEDAADSRDGAADTLRGPHMLKRRDETVSNEPPDELST